MSDELDRVASILGDAAAAGAISEGSQQALLRVGGVGAEVARRIGEEVAADELLLVTILVDDSGSMDNNCPAVCHGHGLLLQALAGTKATPSLVHTGFLNGSILSPYQPLAQATPLTEANYSCGRNTPLYRQSVITLGSVMAKAQEQAAKGRRVRTFTLIITDGGDNDSRGTTAADVRFLVRDMALATNHIVAGMGIGYEDLFRGVFIEMGIPDRWILTPNATVDEMRAALEKVAASLQLAASGEAGFRQLASGPVSGSA